MAWHGSLDLHYRLEIRPDASTHCVGRGEHAGPLRVLQSLYPEGPGICHHVLVHPPGGLVGGDTLAIAAVLEAGAHALLTTPGAARFYRSAGATARQSLDARVAAGARLEWLPLETLVYDAARAHTALRFDLAPGAEMIGWDLLALGLPAAGQPWTRGRCEQQIELAAGGARRWLERAVLDLDDPHHAPRSRRLLDSPLGWGGQAVLATLWFATGTPLAGSRRERLLEVAREAPADAALPAGASAPNDHVVVLRALGPRVEPLMQRLAAVRAGWRQAAWDLAPCAPRVWRT